MGFSGLNLWTGGTAGAEVKVVNGVVKEAEKIVAKEVGESALKIPGRVQSRINIAWSKTRTTPLKSNGESFDAGFKHVVDGHYNAQITSKSQFTISQAELKELLQSPKVVQSKVFTRGDGAFTRIVDVGYTISTTPANKGALPTSRLVVHTDKAGNLLSTYGK